MTRHIRPSPAEALFSAIPVIETERFVMRGYRPEDVAPFIAFYGTERSRFVTGPLTPELAARAFMTYAGHWHVRGYGRWMVEDRASGEVLGNVGLWYPEGWPEAGNRLDPFRGRRRPRRGLRDGHGRPRLCL
jgi:RimJ/RimL family protein N-acetyltransferase